MPVKQFYNFLEVTPCECYTLHATTAIPFCTSSLTLERKLGFLMGLFCKKDLRQLEYLCYLCYIYFLTNIISVQKSSPPKCFQFLFYVSIKMLDNFKILPPVEYLGARDCEILSRNAPIIQIEFGNKFFPCK